MNKQQKPSNELQSRAAYTAAEFAALFGKSKVWAYRLHYAGKIRTIQGFGTLMVPASEVTRITQGATMEAGR
jgi:hypothetical protein